MNFLSKLFGKSPTSAAPPAIVQSPGPAAQPVLPPRPDGDHPLAHWDRKIEVGASPAKVWAVLTDTARWENWFGRMTRVTPDWRDGARIEWADGYTSFVRRLQPGSELSLSDADGNWLTWQISPIGETASAIRLVEDRRRALSMEGAFARHKEVEALLQRLRAVVQPDATPRWELKLTSGGDTGNTHGPWIHGDTLFVVTGNSIHAVTFDGSQRWDMAGGWGECPGPLCVGGGLVVFATLDKRIRALDAVSGEARWECTPKVELESASPTLDDGRVYMATREGDVLVLDAASGTILWTRSQNGRVSPLVAMDGRVFGLGPGPNQYDNTVFALDGRTGETLWGVAAWANRWQSLTVVDGEVYICTSEGLLVLNAETGTKAWSLAFAKNRKLSSPIVSGRRVYVRTSDCGVCCIDVDSQKVHWQSVVTTSERDDRPESPAVGSGFVFSGIGSQLVAMDADTGLVLWQRAAQLVPPPVATDGTVFILDYRRLYALDVAVARA